MNKRLTVPAGKRALAAATLVAALVGSLFVTAAPAGAATGTIVFVSDHNVWIMPADDPSAARPVTTDGTADAPYVAPTADDRGAILAVRGGERGEIVRMDQNGTLLGAPFRPALTGNISDMDLAPDGVVFSYTHYESYSSPEGFVVAPTLDFAYADGSDSSAVANPMFDDLDATFYSATQAVLPGDIEESGDSSFPTVATYTLGDADKQTWFRLCDTSEDFEDWCYPLYADVTDAQDRLVVSLEGGTWVPVGPRLRVFTMSAPAPAEPARSCELVGPEPGIVDDFGFWNPSWSPDGSALVYELNAAFADSPQPAGAGIYLASGFDADCAQAFAGTQLVVPGGSQPDWSAAPLGATPPGP
ncbi:MAG: hypothetical protein M3276_01105, partial [Actinomycetota bacterium]|nr:hypothetical protein [Actinomycetota bacterium]